MAHVRERNTALAAVIKKTRSKTQLVIIATADIPEGMSAAMLCRSSTSSDTVLQKNQPSAVLVFIMGAI